MPPELMRVLLTPLPVGRVINSSLHDAVVELNGAYYLSPAHALESTMRVLEVVKQVGWVGLCGGEVGWWAV